MLIAKSFDLPVVVDEKIKIQKDESIRLEITLSKEEADLIKQAQMLLSHSLEKQNLSVGSTKDLLLYLAKKTIREKTVLREKVKSQSSQVISNQVIKQSENKSAVTVTNKKKIRLRDEICQYRDRNSGRICGSKHFLEVDHIRPRWDFGKNEIENLRMLCSAHNKYRYHMNV